MFDVSLPPRLLFSTKYCSSFFLRTRDVEQVHILSIRCALAAPMKYAGSRRITKFRNSWAAEASTRELRTCYTKTADDTNEPFPVDTETLEDVVRRGAAVPQEG